MNFGNIVIMMSKWAQSQETLRSGVEVTEQGKDWIVRGFDKTSVPLKEAITSNPLSNQVRQQAIDVLINQQGDIPQNILKKLNKNSANLHWSKSKNKIIIIDMQ